MTDQAPELLPFVCPCCGTRGTTDGKSSTVYGDDARPTPAERPVPQVNNMSITFGDRLIDFGHYDITPEQEREIEAREECARRGLDPDDDAADGVTVWMAVDKEMRERRPVPQMREALSRADEADWEWLLLRLDRSARGANWRDIIPAVRAALTARPSDAAVAWRAQMIQFVSQLRQHEIDPEIRDELLNKIMALALPPDEPAREKETS